MELKSISNNELIYRMEKLVRTERKITHLVLIHITEIERRKLYADLGFDGMHSYLTRGLGYSEGSAYRRIQSARLLKNVPTLAQKIEDGSLNLSQLTQVQKCLKESIKNGEKISAQQTLEVLTKLENKNSFETQKTLAVTMNLPVISHEKIKPQQDESIRIEITLTKEQFADLEKAKNLLSHICPSGNLSEVITTLARKYNQSKLSGRKSTQPAIATGVTDKTSEPRSTRKYISIHIKRALLNKAQHCCEYEDPKTKQRCQSRYQLEVDHRQPIALGGGNEIQNLRIICRAHNVLAAEKAGLFWRPQ